MSPSVTPGLSQTLTLQDKLDALNQPTGQKPREQCSCGGAWTQNRGLCRSCSYRARMALDPTYTAWKHAYTRRWNASKRKTNLTRAMVEFDYPVPELTVTPGLWEYAPTGLVQHAAKLPPAVMGKRTIDPFVRVEVMVWLRSGAKMLPVAKAYGFSQETVTAVRDEMRVAA